MKFVVTKMPEHPEACVFAERRCNPPIVEKPYYYICCILQGNHGYCKLSKEAAYNGYNRCPHLVDIHDIDPASMQE